MRGYIYKIYTFALPANVRKKLGTALIDAGKPLQAIRLSNKEVVKLNGRELDDLIADMTPAEALTVGLYTVQCRDGERNTMVIG